LSKNWSVSNLNKNSTHLFTDKKHTYSAMSFADVHRILSPTDVPPCNIGKNLALRQPDVEIAAILLRPLPLTCERFNELSGGKDFMTMQYVVLDVGAPGFSSVPYSNKKGEKATNQLPLYTSSGGATVFHTFSKAESNLERGARVDSMLGLNGEDMKPSCTLVPGLSMSMFIRADAFKGNVFFNNRMEGPDRGKPSELQYVKMADQSPYWSTDVLPENTIVWMQVGVCNSDQAAKGNMLKIKRVMPADSNACFGPALACMPATTQEFDERNEEHKQTNPSIARAIYPGNTKMIACVPDTQSYCNYDEEQGCFMLCDFGTGMSEVAVQASLVTDAMGCSDHGVCEKLLDLAVATGALQVLVRTSVNSDNMDMGSGASAFRGVYLHLDTNKMLSLEIMKGLQGFGADSDPLPSNFYLQHVEGCAVWSNPRHVLSEAATQILFVMDMKEVSLCSVRNANTKERYFSWGCEGKFRKISICLVPRAEASVMTTMVGAMIRKEDSACKLIVGMQLRTQFAKARAASSKRKRSLLMDSDFSEEETVEVDG